MKKTCIIYILLSFCSLHSAHAQSVDSLLQVILSNNLELKALSSSNESVLSDLQSANQVSGPSIEYSPFYTKGYHGMASSELVISQEFDFPTRYAMRKRQMELEGKVMESQYSMRAREITLEARGLCYEIICRNQIIDLLSERMRQSEKLSALLEKRLQAGDGNKLEANKAKLDHMQTSQELAQAENERRELLVQLQLLNANQPLVMNERTFPEWPVPTNSGDRHYPIDLPEVNEAEQALIASEYNQKMAKGDWLPSISVGYRRNTEESLHLNGFLVGASFPLFKNTAHRRSAQQRLEADKLRLEEVKQKAESLQKMRHDELVRLHAVLDHTDTQLLHETLALLDTAIQHGQITALQYYTECDDIYTKLLNHINLHCRYVQLYIQLYMR